MFVLEPWSITHTHTLHTPMFAHNVYPARSPVCRRDSPTRRLQGRSTYRFQDRDQAAQQVNSTDAQDGARLQLKWLDPDHQASMSLTWLNTFAQVTLLLHSSVVSFFLATVIHDFSCVLLIVKRVLSFDDLLSRVMLWSRT